MFLMNVRFVWMNNLCMNVRLNENDSKKAWEVSVMKGNIGIDRFARFYCLRYGETNERTNELTNQPTNQPNRYDLL